MTADGSSGYLQGSGGLKDQELELRERGKRKQAPSRDEGRRGEEGKVILGKGEEADCGSAKGRFLCIDCFQGRLSKRGTSRCVGCLAIHPGALPVSLLVTGKSENNANAKLNRDNSAPPSC